MFKGRGTEMSMNDPERIAELLAALEEYRVARERLLRVLGPRMSNRDPLAEFAEHFVAALMGGRLASNPVQAYWDIELPDGAKVQAKYLVNSTDPSSKAWVNEHLVHSSARGFERSEQPAMVTRFPALAGSWATMPVLELGVRALAGCAELRVGAVGYLLGFGLVLPLVWDFRIGASLVALSARTIRPTASSSSRTPQIHSAFLACTVPGSGPDTPQDVPGGASDDLQVHPVLLVLAGVGRPVRGEAVDGDERPVHDDIGIPGPSSRPGRPCGAWAPGPQQRDSFARVPPGRRGPDPEPGGDLGERLAFAQVNQHQESS